MYTDFEDAPVITMEISADDYEIAIIVLCVDLDPDECPDW